MLVTRKKKEVHSLALTLTLALTHTLSLNHLAKKQLWTTSLLYGLMHYSTMISVHVIACFAVVFGIHSTSKAGNNCMRRS